MKPPRQNVGKAGTKRTKALPDGERIAVRPFPIHLFNANAEASHDLGEILTPAQMAAKATPHAIAEANGEPPDKVPASVCPRDIAKSTGKAIAALVGSGPKQDVPHSDTGRVLAEGLKRLRDFALAGDLAAMRSLGFVLWRAVADLGEMARLHPAIVREWSRTVNRVPVLTGRNAGHAEDLARALDAFSVGELSPYKINPESRRGGGTFNVNTPVNSLAGNLCRHLALHRVMLPLLQKPMPPWARMASVLPELSKATASKWADAAWECLMSATGSQPEDFLELGKERATEGQGAERQKIRQSLREAIQRMACERAT